MSFFGGPIILLAALLLPAVRASGEELELDPLVGAFQAVLRKEGALKALGHDHVVGVRDFRGRASVHESSGSIRLEIDTGHLEIDTPELRKAAGLAENVSAKDRVKIRETMRGEKGLDVLRHPKIVFQSEDVARSGPDGWTARGTLDLRGTQRPLEIPLTTSPSAEGYWVSGLVKIKPSDFGIPPFSVAGGLLRTKDEAEISFRVALRRGAMMPILPPAPTP